MTTALAPIDQLRHKLAAPDMTKQLLNYLGQDEARLRKMQSAVITSVTKVPELLKCDPASMIQAVIACAELNLFPSAVSGECFILPYNGKAQFQLGYQGLITLMYGAGVDAVTTQIVFKNDKFRYEEGLHPVLEHTPAPFGTERGEPIGVYAVAELNGTRVFKVLAKDEVMKIKELSSAKNSKFSPWNSNDPQLWMWRKTCLKQLAKSLPKNERLVTAVGRDNEESVVYEQQEQRRIINPAKLKEAAPTTGSLTVKKDDKKEPKKPGAKEPENPDAADIALFDEIHGSADSNSGE